MINQNNNQKKEIMAIYGISVLIAGWAYIGLRNAKILENSIKLFFLFVLGGLLLGTGITVMNAWYKKYKADKNTWPK